MEQPHTLFHERYTQLLGCIKDRLVILAARGCCYILRSRASSSEDIVDKGKLLKSAIWLDGAL